MGTTDATNRVLAARSALRARNQLTDTRRGTRLVQPRSKAMIVSGPATENALTSNSEPMRADENTSLCFVLTKVPA